MIIKTNIAYQTPKPWRSRGMTRAYLLRACWRLHIPWLPEETKRKRGRGTARLHKKNGLHQKPRHASSTWVVWWRSMQFFKTSSDSFCWVLFNPLTWFIHGPPRSSWFFHLFLISKTFACRNFALLPYHQTFACIMDCGEMMGWEMGGDGWGCSWFS